MQTEIEPIIKEYSYFYDVMQIAISAIKVKNTLAKDIQTVIIELCGSRLSGKTMQALRAFAIELPILAAQHDLSVAVNIIRYEPKGAKETFDELIGAAEDIYGIEFKRNNLNLTDRKMKIANSNIRSIGIVSNRKKSTPKLGISRRGSGKDIEVNIFDEITELDNRKLESIVNQATGGGKFNIRIKIANPWIISMWYIADVAKFVGFNEKLLRDKGQIFKMEINEEEKKLRIGHITNHRINNYLSFSQHQELYDVWKTDEMLARVVDLGMPGVAEGLIYAPVMHMIKHPMKTILVQEFIAGLDWGTSTGANGSATALVLSRIGAGYSTWNIDKEYYHSNSKMVYKNDDTLIRDVIDTVINYVKIYYNQIMQTESQIIKIRYDGAAALLGKALQQELEIRSKDSFKYCKVIKAAPAYKFEVPVRIQIIKQLISQGRVFINKEECPNLWREMESSMWDETAHVKGQATRMKIDDHSLDSLEYSPSEKISRFVNEQAIKYNKYLRNALRQ